LKEGPHGIGIFFLIIMNFFSVFLPPLLIRLLPFEVEAMMVSWYRVPDPTSGFGFEKPQPLSGQ
jgi:hypothetical protein